MSRHSREIINCPNCGHESEFTVWQSINTVLDPDMKAKVRTGEVFKFKCDKCGVESNVNYATLYHQMEDHVMIQLTFGDDVEKCIEFMKGIFKNDKGELVDMDFNFAEENYKNRVVTDMNSFKEKLMILDAELDDRVIELMKLFMRGHFEEKSPDINIEEFLFENTLENGCQFVLHLSDNQWGTVAFDKDMYDMVSENFADSIEKDQEVVVDLGWALNVLRNSD